MIECKERKGNRGMKEEDSDIRKHNTKKCKGCIGAPMYKHETTT